MTNEKREQARILREIGEGWKANGITTGVDACLNGAAALLREAEAASLSAQCAFEAAYNHPHDASSYLEREQDGSYKDIFTSDAWHAFNRGILYAKTEAATSNEDWEAVLGDHNTPEEYKNMPKPIVEATALDVSEAELAEWEALCEKATPGPWGVEETDTYFWVGPLRKDGSGKAAELVAGYNIEGVKESWYEQQCHNAFFHAASRTALPRLIAALRAACKREGHAVDALRRIVSERDFSAPEKMLHIAQDFLAARETAVGEKP